MAGNRKKVHTSWADGTEMVEEYDLAADVLLSATAFFLHTLAHWPIGFELGRCSPQSALDQADRWSRALGVRSRRARAQGRQRAGDGVYF